jgi:hypothetical protein
MQGFVKTSAFTWHAALPLALLVHAAVFALAIGGSAKGAFRDRAPALNLVMTESDPLDADPTARRDAAEELPVPEFAQALDRPERPVPSIEQNARTVSVETRTSATATPPDSARDSPAVVVYLSGERTLDTLGGDTPLSVTLTPARPAARAREPAPEATLDSGPSTRGYVVEKGQGNDLFTRMANRMAAQHQQKTFALSGQPGYPKSCRKGICRNGVPCEGSSQWRVIVGPGGGTPERVEALQPMECALQNAAIRLFFAEYKFPKTGQTETYIFPVEMRISR